MKNTGRIKRIVSLLLCFVILFSAAPELWCLGVNAVAETIEEVAVNTNQVAEEPNLAEEIPDGVEDATITSNLTLTEDTTYRNLEITKGTVDLQGNQLEIYGDLKLLGGKITFNGGSLIVHGNFEQKNALQMKQEKDYLLVYGDYLCYYGNSSYNSTIVNGVVEFKGNVYQKGDGSSNSNRPKDYAFIADNTVILSGDDVQEISFESPYSKFSNLSIRNPNVQFKTHITAKLINDAQMLSIDDGVDLNLNGFTLEVQKDVIHTDGLIEFNGGSLIIHGNFEQKNALQMKQEKDYLLVYGDYLCYYGNSSYDSSIVNGVVEFKGNVYQKGDGSSNSARPRDFAFIAENTVILSGDDVQEISFESPYSKFSNLSIRNPNVQFKTHVTAKLINDAQMLSIDDGVDLNLNGFTLEVQKDVIHTDGLIQFNGGRLIVHGNFEQKNALQMKQEKDYLLVYGDYLCYYGNSSYNSTIVNGVVEFKGNVYQKGDGSSNSARPRDFAFIAENTVILSGDDVQEISFESPYSKFSKLVLTKDIANYIFENVRYSTLEYTNNTDEYADSVFSNLVTFDKDTQCAFHVYSRQDAISGIYGATVTFNGVTKKTDRNGLVVFDKPEGENASITVTKSGYHDYVSTSYSLNEDSGCNYISMTALDAKSYIVSATCNSYDVLTATARLDCSRYEPVYITVEAKSEYPISEYALMQGDTVVATNLTGVFVLNTSDFEAKTQVAVRIRNTAGTVATYGININVYDSKAENNSWPIVNSVSIGGNLTVTIDKDVPVVGGMTVKVGSSTCPVSVSTTKDKIKICINVPVDEATVYTQETILKYLTHTEGDKTTEKVKTSFAGYMECIFDEDGNMVKTKGIAYMTVGYTGNYDFTTVIGVVPVTLGVSVSASGGVVIDMIGYDFENSQFLFPDVGWTASGAITAKVGVGVKYLSAGIYGNLTNNWIGSIFPDFEFEKWTISGELGVYGKVAIFEGKWPLLKTGVLQVYPYDSAVDPAAMVMSADCLYSAEEYTLISYATRLSASLESYAIENGWVLDADAYSYAEPSIVTAGDTTVMVYLDHDATRSNANAQVLVYRIYDNETATWSEAIPVDANQTADSEFSVYRDGNAIYLIYTEAREQLADDIDIYSFPKEIEVAFAIFDNEAGAFGTPVRLTQNSVFETLPSICVVDNTITATWIENAENDIFCANNANIIVMSQYIDGVWITTRLVAGLPTVTDIAVGEMGEQGVVSYILDSDCDLTTQEDKQIFILNTGTRVVTSCAENGFYSDLTFSTVQGENCVVWCADNNLYYTTLTEGTIAAHSVFIEPVEGLDNYRIYIGENGRAMILFLRNGENLRTLWAISGNCNSNVWGAPMELTNNKNYINAFDAFFDNGVLSIVYTDATVTTTEDSFETVSALTYEKLDNKVDIGITDVQVNYADIVPGEDATIKVAVQNNGFEPVTGFTLTMTNAEGTIVATEQIQATIESGNVAEVEFIFTLPSASSEQYIMEVSFESGADMNSANDSMTFDLWCCDLSVVAKQIIIGTNNYISATVTNGGYLSSNGTLQVVDSTGNVIASKPIKLIGYGEAEELLINLNDESLAIPDSGLYTIRVVSANSDFYEENNDTSIYLVDIDIGNGLEILCEHTYGDWIIITPPALNRAGERKRVCSICNNVEAENLDMLEGKVSQWNLVLQDDFKVNFYLIISEAITHTAQVNITVGKTIYSLPVSDLSITEDGHYFISVGVAAAQMNDIIALQVFNGEDCGQIYTYTVRQYCDTILTDEAHSEYHALVKEMLHYGAMAQMYFDYDLENLANEGITGVASEEVPETAEEMTVTDKIGALNFYGASLVYRDRIAMRYYFTGDVTGMTFTANGNTYTPVAKDGMYYVEIVYILPQNLDQQITMTVTDADGNTLNVTYGPMNYIVRMNQKGDDNLKNLLRALYNYHLATKQLSETTA